MLCLDDLTPIYLGSDFYFSENSLSRELKEPAEPSEYLGLKGWDELAADEPVQHLFTRLSEEKEKGVSSREESEAQNSRRIQNDTKNIPKNYGKGIITFMQKNEKLVRHLASVHGVAFADLSRIMRDKKRNLNTIA